MTEIELIAVFIAAILAGAVNALAGGGTLITFPVLLAVGAPAVVANVTNTVALCPGYLGGALAQFKDLSGEARRMHVFGITGALGGVGGILLLNTGEETFRVLVPYLILFAAGLLAIEGPVHRWHEQRIVQGETRQINGVWNVFPVFLASIYGGYFGGGLSVIVLAVLSLVSLESLTRLNALKQVIALCLYVAAAIFFLFSGKVRWSANGSNGYWGANRRRNRRISGRSSAARSAALDCCGVRGGNLRRIFRSIGNGVTSSSAEQRFDYIAASEG